MSDKSPMFVSSVELLAHATELYSQGNERKYKFVILHLANSVELILKDRLIDKGVSIYIAKKPQTIGIWDAFDELQKVGVNIPERPVIELLIDDRNTIQHRFGFPDAETVYYYLEQTVSFFKRFFSDEYNVNLAEVLKLHLSAPNLALIGLAEKKEDEYASLDKLFAISPESAVMQAYNLLEKKYLDVIGSPYTSKGRPSDIFRDADFAHLLRVLAGNGYLSDISPARFMLLRDMRNRAAHSAHFQSDLNSPEWAVALNIAKELLVALDKAAANGDIPKRRTSHQVEEEKAGVASEETNRQQENVEQNAAT